MKKTRFARDLFAHTDWLPKGYEASEITMEQKSQKKPEKLSRQDALNSMKNFTDKVLESNDVQKVVLNNVEVSREKSTSNFILSSQSVEKSWEALNKSWEHNRQKLMDLKSKQNVKILFVVHNHLEALPDQESALLLAFTKEQESLFVKMVGAMKIPSQQIAVSAVSAESLNWSSEKALESLHHEINVLNPQYIVSFGAMATHALLRKKVRLSLVQGEFFNYTLGFSDESAVDKSFQLMPLFHPEYLLINPNMKRKTWDGMKKIMARL